MKLRQEWTVLQLEKNISRVGAGEDEAELTEIYVPLSDIGKEEVQGPNVAKDEVVEAVEDVGRFHFDLTIDQQDRQNGFWNRQRLCGSSKTVCTFYAVAYGDWPSSPARTPDM